MTTSELGESIRNMARTADAIAERLDAKVRPGHVDYISKADAAAACRALARKAREATSC